jgi:uncharacterized membrane protein YqjE
MTTATATGLRPSEYNALIHAMWRIDSTLKSPDYELTEKERATLERDRQALQDLFVRLG